MSFLPFLKNMDHDVSRMPKMKQPETPRSHSRARETSLKQ